MLSTGKHDKMVEIVSIALSQLSRILHLDTPLRVGFASRKVKEGQELEACHNICQLHFS